MLKDKRWSKRDIARNRALTYKYGITKELADDFINGLMICAVCGSNEKICVDHDHVTNEYRGPLCVGCNAALGYLKEDPERIINLAKYIRLFKKQGEANE